MKIHGIGIIFSGGRGVASFDTALRSGSGSASHVEVSGFPCPVPAFQVKPELLKDKEVLKGMRRADRLSKLALLSAWDAWQDAGPLKVAPERIGIVLATGLGPHARTFKFLDGILDFDDTSVSPTDFSHSVHNAAAGYIANRLGANGPVQTITDFDSGFSHALTLAECWLEEQRCDTVLLGTAEELGDVMLNVCKHLLHIPETGAAPPFQFETKPSVIPGEGAAFFVLSRQPEGNDSYASITANRNITSSSSGLTTHPDLTILDADGLSGNQTHYAEKTQEKNAQFANYTPCFGSMMTGIALQCAAAALMIKKQTFYASPLADSTPSLPLCRETKPARIKAVDCLKIDRQGKESRITLSA